MNQLKTLIAVHLGYQVCDLQEEIFEGTNCSVEIRYFGINYQGLKGACARKRPIYMYSHSGQTVSLSPFSCPWDSGIIGYIWTNSDRLAEGLIKELDQVIRNDYYALYEEDSEGIIRDFGDSVFEGSYQDCIKYAKENGQEIKYFQDRDN